MMRTLVAAVAASVWLGAGVAGAADGAFRSMRSA